MSMITEAPTTPPVGGLPPPQPPTPTPPPPPPRPKRRPTRGRSLWVIFGSLFLIAAVGWGTFNVVDLIAHEERTEQFSVAAEQLDRLLVENDNGSVTVVGTGTDEVAVTADVSDGLRKTGFRHDEIGSTLELHGSCKAIGAMWCRVRWDVETPREFAVEVDAQSGSVDVVDIAGDVRVDADDGSVELSNVSGSIVLDSDNGSIVGGGLSGPVAEVSTDNGRIELSFVEPPDRVVASGDNGRIEIVLPEIEGGYRVAADTDHGEADLDLNNNPDSPRTVDVETANGSIVVRTVERG
jgi:hypothetical protein